VSKARKSFKAQIQNGRTQEYIGTFRTCKQAALAFDHRAIELGFKNSRLNFPNGPPSEDEDDEDDEDNDELMNPKEEKRLKSNNTSGYTGVYKMKNKWWAKINIKGKAIPLGIWVTKTAAAIAYDQAIDEHKLDCTQQGKLDRHSDRYTKNFPDGLLSDDDDCEMPVSVTSNATGYRGVSTSRTKGGIVRFQAKITGLGVLGTFDTAKEAALAYDEVQPVVWKKNFGEQNLLEAFRNQGKKKPTSFGQVMAQVAARKEEEDKHAKKAATSSSSSIPVVKLKLIQTGMQEANPNSSSSSTTSTTSSSSFGQPSEFKQTTTSSTSFGQPSESKRTNI